MLFMWQSHFYFFKNIKSHSLNLNLLIQIIKNKKEGEKIINIYSTKTINLITLFISIIFFLFINLLFYNINKVNPVKNDINPISEEAISENITQENNQNSEINEKNENASESENENDNDNAESLESNMQEFDWCIEIPAIELKAPIKETTNMEILNNYVGHFEETPQKEGNVGLAGHNRGYENNYFENLNKIKIGDEIKYKYYEFEKKYSVEKIEKIKNTDWSFLDNSEQNEITLITCIENEPDYRLCVQAIEKQ